MRGLLKLSLQGVVGGIIVSPEGVILRTSCDVRSQALVSCNKSPISCFSKGQPKAACLFPQANTAEQHAQLIPQLVSLAKSMIRDLDPQVRSQGSLGLYAHAGAPILLKLDWTLQNELEFLRVRSHKHEIMVAPSKCGAGSLALHFGRCVLSQGLSW